MLNLALCAAASTLRMLVAYVISVLIAMIAGVAMARNRVVERLLLPILDVLQSVPILGFFPVALAFFVRALPVGLGQEVAAVFLIVTSQIWNLIFGVYTSVKSLEPALFDMAKIYRLGKIATFFRICVPAARNSLVANSLISWAGGWFFLTSSEVISMGSEEYRLVGLGTYIVEAFELRDALNFYLGLAILLGIIMATYILIWNPAAQEVLERRLPAVVFVYDAVRGIVARLWGSLGNALEGLSAKLRAPRYAFKIVSAVLLAALALITLPSLPSMGAPNVEYLLNDTIVLLEALPLSLTRVAGVVALSAAVSLSAAYAAYRWERMGLAVILAGEILASIPAILWWPLLAGVAVGSPLGPHIVSLVVYLQGSAWYLFFNLLIYGLASMKKEIEEMAKVYRLSGLWYWRNVFVPFLMPSLASGALSAWGGAWNASIAAEYVELEDHAIDLGGVGAQLTKLSLIGDYAGVAYSALLLSLVIVIINKTFWRKVFEWVEEKYGGGVE